MGILDKVATAVFWLVLGVPALVGSSAIIYLTLEMIVRRDLLGRDYCRDCVIEWGLFWGAVVILVLSILGIREGLRKLRTRKGNEGSASQPKATAAG